MAIRPSKVSVFRCPSVDQSGWWVGSVQERARWRSWCRASSMCHPAKFSWTVRIFESFSLRELRRTLGYVPQDPFLFSTTLRRNLTFGRDEVSDEELARAVGIARLDRDLAIFPQGINTIVGERGVTLSGGQKQRATLARALVMDPPVLILDDCLSSVDAQTEAEILQGLKRFSRRRPVSSFRTGFQR